MVIWGVGGFVLGGSLDANDPEIRSGTGLVSIAAVVVKILQFTFLPAKSGFGLDGDPGGWGFRTLVPNDVALDCSSGMV